MLNEGSRREEIIVEPTSWGKKSGLITKKKYATHKSIKIAERS